MKHVNQHYSYLTKEEFEALIEYLETDPDCEKTEEGDGDPTTFHHSLFTTPARVRQIAQKFGLTYEHGPNPNFGVGRPGVWNFDPNTNDVLSWETHCASVGTDWRERQVDVQV